MKAIQGIHHITAIAGDPQANIAFYHSLLGQRLVKRTVNFDDPGTYHFYFGDGAGTPGTILTFFPWQRMPRGVRGNGEVAATAYTIPTTAMGFWKTRLTEHGIPFKEEGPRFGAQLLSFTDPDGMGIELVASDEPTTIQHWADGPIPAEYALRGFHSATLWVSGAAATGQLLTEQLGYEPMGQEENRYRYRGASHDIGLYVDLLEQPNLPPARMGAGSVHHIAFRTVDDTEQAEYKQLLHKAGYGVSPVMDRQYFHSIYFRSPGGVLFEVATDSPGFAYDEPMAELGQNLKLPDWLEPEREKIAAKLPPISLATLTV